MALFKGANRSGSPRCTDWEASWPSSACRCRPDYLARHERLAGASRPRHGGGCGEDGQGWLSDGEVGRSRGPHVRHLLAQGDLRADRPGRLSLSPGPADTAPPSMPVRAARGAQWPAPPAAPNGPRRPRRPMARAARAAGHHPPSASRLDSNTITIYRDPAQRSAVQDTGETRCFTRKRGEPGSGADAPNNPTIAADAADVDIAAKTKIRCRTSRRDRAGLMATATGTDPAATDREDRAGHGRFGWLPRDFMFGPGRGPMVRRGDVQHGNPRPARRAAHARLPDRRRARRAKRRHVAAERGLRISHAPAARRRGPGQGEEKEGRKGVRAD